MVVNDGLKGDTTYPNTLEAAVLVLKGCKPTFMEKRNQDSTAATKNKDGVVFTQTGTDKSRKGKMNNREYYAFDERGNHVYTCPRLTEEESEKIYLKREWTHPGWTLPVGHLQYVTAAASPGAKRPRKARKGAAPKTVM